MIDLVKKAMFTGIGMLSLSKDKIEEISRDFIEKGKMSEQEGAKLVDELFKKSEESRKNLQTQVENQVRAMMEKMDLSSKKDLAALQNELAEIKAELNSLKK